MIAAGRAQAAAARMGKRAARIWFNQRGNRSETHISEESLAALISGALELALMDAKGVVARCELQAVIESQRAALGLPPKVDA